MTIHQLVQTTGVSAQEIKELLETDFHRIILSDYVDMSPDLTERLINRLENVSFVPIPQRTENQVYDRMSSIDPCLNDLLNVEFPGIQETKKLLTTVMRRDFLLFIDTCSVLHVEFYNFFEILRPLLKKFHTQLIIPYVVLEELRCMAENQKKPLSVRKRAKKAVPFILKCQDERLIQIFGGAQDQRTNEKGEKAVHADKVIIEKLIYYRDNERDSLFITQDHGATEDALHINNMKSSRTKAVVIAKKIGMGGILVDNSRDIINPSLDK